jgi:hypothetical protein
MRFVGGQISHAGNAQVTTPNAVVGIRGGVGIFTPQNVYIGYGEGNVRSGSSNVTLSAGEYTQTLGGGAPPTNPGAPPSGFLQSVLASLQSQQGQGGGARATAGQVNQARTSASGSSAGTIATNVQNVVNQTVNNATNQTNAIASLNQTIQTTANQSRIEMQEQETRGGEQYLAAFTGGLVFSRNNYGPFGPIIAALGGGAVQTNAQGQNELAAFGAGRVGDITPGPYNPYAGPSDEFQAGVYLYGPNSANVHIDDLATGASVLLPATSPGGAPAAIVNSQVVSQFNGGFVEFKPGTALSQAASQTVGVTFCQCEYTRWGLWAAETTRPGPNVNGGSIKDTVEMFWVAGRLPANASDIPAVGSATYTGHAIAHIQNGGSSYVAAGPFQNTINFGTQTGNVSINIDSANYTGQIMFSSGSPVFVGGLSAPSANRSMNLIGAFFQGRTSPVGEMGGNLSISGANNYGGAGIFAARK